MSSGSRSRYSTFLQLVFPNQVHLQKVEGGDELVAVDVSSARETTSESNGQNKEVHQTERCGVSAPSLVSDDTLTPCRSVCGIVLARQHSARGSEAKPSLPKSGS